MPCLDSVREKNVPNSEETPQRRRMSWGGYPLIVKGNG
ncbi:rCG48880 [Rattus norvegicus]|uniref:RCG48880 n=1 Tax=Rattus norvegicus TaxID=10116 RepID=A6IFL4_RAT|nr:rCG48880 [Rattus norvegicus]